MSKPAETSPQERALDAVARSRREGLSLTRAARSSGTTRKTVLRYAGRAYRREGRRYVPRDFDRIPRAMTVLTPEGPMVAIIRDSRTASAMGEHANAVRRYIEQGDVEDLRNLRRKSVHIEGHTYRLAIDPARIDRLAEGGELHYELYAR